MKKISPSFCGRTDHTTWSPGIQHQLLTPLGGRTPIHCVPPGSTSAPAAPTLLPGSQEESRAKGFLELFHLLVFWSGKYYFLKNQLLPLSHSSENWESRFYLFSADHRKMNWLFPLRGAGSQGPPPTLQTLDPKPRHQ